MNLLQRFLEFWEKITSSPANIVGTALCFLLFVIMYYSIIKILVVSKAKEMLFSIVAILVLSALIVILTDSISGAFFLIIPITIVIFITVIFSVEIKRAFWIKKKRLGGSKRNAERINSDEYIDNCTQEIIKAVQNMSKNDTGAIIVLASNNFPSQIIDSGIKLDCDISSELIESVFFPKAPLHDGAMIINGTRVVASGCFLPLTQNVDNIPKELGTRHRAGIGVTETIDVVSIIVSEETGVISIAKGGKITRYADFEMLKKTLSDYYWQNLGSANR